MLLAEVQGVVAQANRIAGDVSLVSGKAGKLSGLLVDQVIGPTARVAAIVSGVRTGAKFLVDNWLHRRRSSTGGNNHE